MAPPPALSRYLGGSHQAAQGGSSTAGAGPGGLSLFGHPQAQAQQQQLQPHHHLAGSTIASGGAAHLPGFGNPTSLFASSGTSNGGFGGGFPGATAASGLGGMAAGLGAGVAGNNGGVERTGLGSRAAQMGFAHGAALQQQEANDAGIGMADARHYVKGRIRDVWRGNLAQEMAVLRGLVDKYPYISMVCGTVITPSLH